MLYIPDKNSRRGSAGGLLIEIFWKKSEFSTISIFHSGRDCGSKLSFFFFFFFYLFFLLMSENQENNRSTGSSVLAPKLPTFPVESAFWNSLSSCRFLLVTHIINRWLLFVKSYVHIKCGCQTMPLVYILIRFTLFSTLLEIRIHRQQGYIYRATSSDSNSFINLLVYTLQNSSWRILHFSFGHTADPCVSVSL